MPIKLRETQKTATKKPTRPRPKRLEIRVSKLTKRELYKKNQEIDEIKEKTDVLYNGELLPEEVRKESPVFYKLYNLSERIFPSTGLLMTFVCTALSSMCTAERRQFNLLIGKEVGEGGTLVISQLARIPFIRDIYDYKTAAGFCLDYLGFYLERVGREIPKGVVPQGKRGYRTFDKSNTLPIHNQFFISKGMDRLFHQGHGVLEKTLNFQNPLFEEGYAIFSDGYAGSYTIGSKDRPVKCGFIGICVPPNTLIMTKNNLTPIENIKVGDLVITHKGNVKRVSNIIKRHYAGDLVKIKPYYSSSSISLTPEHPILAIKCKRCSFGSKTFCYENCTDDRKGRKGCKEHYKTYKETWIRAGELDKGDLLVLSFPSEEKNINIIKISDFVDTYKYSYIIRNGLIYKTGRASGVTNVINNNIKLNEETLRLFGYYLAEGCTSEYTVNFDFGRKEEKYVADVMDIMESLFGVVGNESIRESTISVSFHNPILAKFFDTLFGSVSNKKSIPNFIMNLPRKKLYHLIIGLFRGDGGAYYGKDGKYLFCSYCTTSRKLMHQVRLILMKLGLMFSLKISKPRIIKIGNRKVKCNTLYSLSSHTSDILIEDMFGLTRKPYKTRSRRGYIDNEKMYSKIQNIRKEKYMGYVYNLEVEDDNSYNTISVSLHNCTLEDLANKALKTSGWIERIVVGTWLSHPKEDNIIIQGINRKLLPEIDISYKVFDLLEHLNPNYPMKVRDWNEEVAKQLDKFAKFIKEARHEKKGKRSARDATRIIQALPVLNRRYYVLLSDLAVMDGFMTTMRTNPTVLGWRVPFQYAIRRWFQKSDEAIRSILKTFRKWDGSPLYTEKDVINAVRAYYGKQGTLG